MEEFNLENHKWLTKMINIRSTWIPAYFIDSPLCGLMRTTSRHVQERLDHKTYDTIPNLKTYLSIERHASNVYTRSLFDLVQKEIFAGTWHCQIDTKSVIKGSNVSVIKENPFVNEMKRKMKNPQSMDKGFMDLIHLSEQISVSQNYVLCDVVDQCPAPPGSALTSLSTLTKEVVAYEHESYEAQAIKIIKENPFVNEMKRKMKNPQSMDKGKDKDE
nr:hypothetical protein [Tanacetum cinerariifolium]